MRDGVIQHASSVRAPQSLVARGGLARTFGGLAGFLAVTFLGWGVYILQDALANPLNEGAPAVVFGAFMITLAAALLFFLVGPVKRSRTTSPEYSSSPATASVQPGFLQVPRPMRQEHSRNNLAYQRIYIDHSLIRP